MAQLVGASRIETRISVKDGSVVTGPAPSPLPAAKVTVSGGQIELA